MPRWLAAVWRTRRLYYDTYSCIGRAVSCIGGAAFRSTSKGLIDSNSRTCVRRCIRLGLSVCNSLSEVSLPQPAGKDRSYRLIG